MKRINRYKRLISYYLRKKVDQKLLVMESDDWGLERARDSNALEAIISKYGAERISRWTKDSLETVDDLVMIYDLFELHKDKFNSPPVLTANFVTHNLDYQSKYELKFKPISQGYNYGDAELFNKYNEGIKKKYFIPQLHGFSHYNVALLKKDFDSENFLEDFELGFPLAKSTIKGNLSMYRGECFDPDFSVNFSRATEAFNKRFGYYSTTFIPPNYIYNRKQSRTLIKNKIELLQSGATVVTDKGKNLISPFFRKKSRIIRSCRNARLDTHQDYNYLADHCINQINKAFEQKSPAVIDIHRVNFSGKFSPETREKTLTELDKVFTYLHKHHPQTKFLSSNELVKYLI